MLSATEGIQLWETAALGFLALHAIVLLAVIMIKRPQTAIIYIITITLCFGGAIGGAITTGLWSFPGVRKAIGIAGAILFAILIYNIWRLKTRRSAGSMH
jgi:Mg2+/citrate symporter